MPRALWVVLPEIRGEFANLIPMVVGAIDPCAESLRRAVPAVSGPGLVVPVWMVLAIRGVVGAGPIVGRDVG